MRQSISKYDVNLDKCEADYAPLSPTSFIRRASNAFPEAHTISEQDLIEFSRNHLAHFKRPTSTRFEILPKTSIGKIQKFELRARLKQEKPHTGSGAPASRKQNV